jgi:uncharacterized protein with NAD-binding domain and iron-sulfur cluster
MYRPDQVTPVPNFFLAGSYTKQVRGPAGAGEGGAGPVKTGRSPGVGASPAGLQAAATALRGLLPRCHPPASLHSPLC